MDFEEFLELLPEHLQADANVAEKKLYSCIAEGEIADYFSDNEEVDSLNFAYKWSDDCRTIRAEFLVWLCADEDNQVVCVRTGIEIVGVKVKGRLNLARAAIPHALSIRLSKIEDGICLDRAMIEFLDLTGSHVGPIAAEKLSVRGDINFCDGFRAKGEILLRGANIDGDLNFSRGVFENAERCAIFADAVTVKGGIFFNNGFRAEGLVRLLYANVTHDMYCDNGTFRNIGGMALAADGLTVGGCVYLSNGFISEGEVRLPFAKIGVNLDCVGGFLKNKSGYALRATKLNVGGFIFFRKGFRSSGEIQLDSASIGNSLELADGYFDGRVNIVGAVIKRNLYAQGAVIINKTKTALMADGLSVAVADLSNGFKAYGEVSFIKANFRAGITCSGSTFINEGRNAINANGIVVDGNMALGNNFYANGSVVLHSATIMGDLNCDKSMFYNPSGIALQAQKMEVKGTFALLTVDKPIGIIDFAFVKVNQLVDNELSWPYDGNFRMDGFEYNAFAGSSTPKSAYKRLKWLRLRFPKDNLFIEHPRNSTPVTYFLKEVIKRITQQQPLLFLKIIYLKYIKPTHSDFNKHISRYEFRPQPYEQLATVLKKTGHENDARRVIIAKREALRKSGELGNLRRPWHTFLYYTTGYGWWPHLPLIFLFCTMVLGCVFFHLANNAEVMVQTKFALFAKCNTCIYPKFNPLIYSIDTLLPFVNLHQEIYWLPQGSIFYRFFLWAHISVGWVLSALAAVSLSGLLRKH